MSAAVAVLKAIPLWLILALAAAGVIWWQHGQIGKARADAAEQAGQAGQCKLARDKAVAEARASAQADYQAANRIQQERTGGDQCTAATWIIDKELGL